MDANGHEMEQGELRSKVKAVMKETSLSQKALAKVLGIPRTTVIAWLNGGRVGTAKMVNEETLARVAAAVERWLDTLIEAQEGEAPPVAGEEGARANAAPDPVERLIVSRPLVPGSREAEDPVYWWSLRLEEGWSMREIGASVGYDASVVSRVFAGKYPGDMDAVRTACAEARARVLGSGDGAEVRTRTGRLVEEALLEARGTEWLTVLFGDPGIGKTHGVRAFARAHRDSVRVLTLEASATSGSLLADLAESLGLGAGARRLGQSDLASRVVEAMRRSPKLIVLDECNNLARRPEKAARILNLVRHINDLAHCGVALVGTLNLFDLLFSPRSSVEMEMVRSRVGTEVELPAAGEMSLRAFLQAHFGRFEDTVWKRWMQHGRRDGGGGCPTMRRAAIFVSHARQVAIANGNVGEVGLTEGLVDAGWGRMRRRI